MESVLAWLAEDPVRVLTIVGGSGGLMYWFDRFLSRPRMRARILREDSSPEEPAVEFEAQNVGMAPLSLEPTVVLTGYTPKIRRHVTAFLVDPTLDGSLPPHVPKMLRASAPPDEQQIVGFLWYRKYTLAATRGRRRLAYLRYVNGPRLSAIRFYTELLMFRVSWTRGLLLKRVAPPS